MDVSAGNGLTLYIYTAPVGSKTAEALNLLASWTATVDAELAPDADAQQSE